jgi:hypothetical protein
LRKMRSQRSASQRTFRHIESRCWRRDEFSHGPTSIKWPVYLINSSRDLDRKRGRDSSRKFCGVTLDLSNSAFLNGEELRFQGESQQPSKARVKFSHWWEMLHSSAQAIANSGDRCFGVIALSAGREIIYHPHGDERIQIRLQKAEEESWNVQASIKQAH